ncbi:MFS transporter [Brevibacillus fluminis]|uniref:MFS transporter n=1 Tax=Brevibacillus fluminis TaxID=511487 RepID=A0A3M8CW68_9BACL|nr:MFS transporter [Brevibacillus fluminis]RNB79601.1 MFS transporter [Brevibacillus fluminis]
MKNGLTKPFILLTSGVYVESTAKTITYFGTISLVMSLSDNPFHVGILTMLETIAMIACSAIAGILADRFDRKTIILTSFLASGLCTTALYFAHALWQIYLLELFNGIAFAMYLPARKALQPSLVAEVHFVDANSFDSMLRNITLIARPPIAAFLIALLGANHAFLIAGALTIAATMIVWFVRTPTRTKQPHKPSESDTSTGWQELLVGWKTIRQDAALTYLVIVSMLVTFVFAMQGTLLFIHVKQNLSHYGQTEAIVGYLFSAIGAGGLAGALLVRACLRYIRILPLFLLTLLIDGMLVIVFAFSTNLYVVVSLWLIFGITATMNTIVTDTIIQQTVQPSLRGRVYGIFSTVNEPISLLSTGIGTSMAGIIGAKLVFASVGALETFVAAAGRMLHSRSPRKRVPVDDKL